MLDAQSGKKWFRTEMFKEDLRSEARERERKSISGKGNSLCKGSEIRLHGAFMSNSTDSPPYARMRNPWIRRTNCTTPLYRRDLSIHGFWYLWGSWN